MVELAHCRQATCCCCRCWNKDLFAQLLPVVRPDVLLKVVLAAESLSAAGANMRPDPGVDQLVPGELFIASESFIAIRVVTSEGPFAGVDADVVLELAVVREGHFAGGALKVFWSVLLIGRRQLLLLLVLLVVSVHGFD